MLRQNTVISELLGDLLSMKIDYEKGNDTMKTAQEKMIISTLISHGFGSLPREAIGINYYRTLDGVKGLPRGTRSSAKMLHSTVTELIKKGSVNIPLFNVPETGRYFIYQPLGTQRVTDFLLIVDGQFVHLEGKSAKEDHIVWNDSAPRKNVVYFTTQFNIDTKTNDNTVVLGQDVCSGTALRMIDTFWANHRAELAKLNEELRHFPEKNPGGLSFNSRPKYQQSGGSFKTSFLANQDRSKRENRVKKYIAKQLGK